MANACFKVDNADYVRNISIYKDIDERRDRKYVYTNIYMKTCD